MAILDSVILKARERLVTKSIARFSTRVISRVASNGSDTSTVIIPTEYLPTQAPQIWADALVWDEARLWLN